MASPLTSRDLDVVLQRFFRLSRAQQLGAYRAIRDHLADTIRETKNDRVVAAKEEALRALGEVARHLSLPAGVAPTPDQFDAAARELGLGWDRSRVRRAWRRWRFAKAAFLGEALPASMHVRSGSRVGRRGEREAPLEGVRLWLETKPDVLSAAAYGEWARGHNDNLPVNALPVATAANSIAHRFKYTWPDVVRLARGEITEDQARPPRKRANAEFCNGPHQLVSQRAMTRILKKANRTLRIEMARPGFPAPVIVVPGTQIWLRDDVKAYNSGRRWTPEEKERQRDSLRDLYMTVADVMDATGFNRAAVDMGRKGVPRPVARIGFRNLWLRSDVEAWQAEKRGQSLP